MRRQLEAGRGMRRIGQLVGLVALAVLLTTILYFPVGAQETPVIAPDEGGEATQETPVIAPPDTADVALLKLEVEASEEPIPKGEEFEVTVLVEDVEHLASFAFAIQYDPKRLELVEEEAAEEGTPRATPVEGASDGEEVIVSVRDVGAFLETSDRREGLFCFDPVVSSSERIVLSCVTAGAPLCLDGLAGASGSGVLGRVLFKSKGGGTTDLQLTDTMLVLDDVEPCDPDPDVGQAQEIAHRAEGATLELAETGGFPWVVVGAIIAVVVVVLIGGGVGGFVWSRRGGTGTPP